MLKVFAKFILHSYICVNLEGDDEGEAYEKPETQVDDAFLKFQKRVEFEPEQIIRYAIPLKTSQDESRINKLSSIHDNNVLNKDTVVMEPLWIAESRPDNIPPCLRCQGPRTYEFQIMPQLLLHLDLDHADPNCLDWGTVIVYSCEKRCALNGDFSLEWCWVQMPSEAGIAGEKFRQ